MHECELEDVLTLEREPYNPEDRNAIKVLHLGRHLGYIGREDAQALAPKLDAGEVLTATFEGVWQLEYAHTNGAIEVAA